MDEGDFVIGASEFKAKCLKLMDCLTAGILKQIVVTKHGRVVAVLRPPPAPQEVAGRFFGFMRGRVIAPEGLDFTEPVLDEPLDADGGRLHR